ncbi:GGDEF domain-containing protein [Aquamicrobium ahrensii]|uniref:diguanylate cyclase n=1 Tax=Aquamicrobium ahrensii TaxID=469551 RepID=A0ABV2KFA6_9HYPH
MPQKDAASTVLATMRKLGVTGLPRNYEIFYETLSGGNPALGLAVIALGNRPTQQQLDDISRRFFAHHCGQGVIEQARHVLARELEEVAGLLRSERTQVEKYGRILHETSDGLANRSAISHELLQKIVGAIAAATSSTIDRGKQVESALSDKSAELEAVKCKLEEYKRLADTDPLTQILNRRAFDKEIARIYSSRKDILFNALILADIDNFKKINDRFGHPVGDRIIRTIADIFQSSVRRDVFVARTGGEEFALIVEGSSEDTTFEIAERLRKLVEQTQFVDPATGADYGPVTVSMGVCMAAEADTSDDLYIKADRALYRSKVSGRNKVTKHSSLPNHSNNKWLLYRKD